MRRNSTSADLTWYNELELYSFIVLIVTFFAIITKVLNME